MAKMRTNDLEKLQQAFARPERIHDGAMLAGSALAMPLLTVRQRQARMEAARTRARLGDAHPETKARQAQAAALTERAGHMGTDIARQKLVKPVVGDQAGLYGRVTRDGAPMPGLAVSALDEKGEMIVHSCTGRDGDYALSFQPDQKIMIEVRDADRRLWRDDKGTSYPAYRPVHRDIELSKAKPVCPGDRPTKPGGYVQIPSLVGMYVADAEKTLEALGLVSGQRKSRKAAEAGIVLEQDPGAGASTEAGGAVNLVVSTGDERPAAKIGDLQGKSLAKAIDEVTNAGVALGAVSVATGGGRTARVEAAKPDETGERINLQVKSSGGDAQLTQVVAAVLATTEEAKELLIEGKAAAADWLKKHKLTNIEKIGEALAMEDAALRRRLRLKKDHPVGAARSLLQAAVSRVRKV